MRVIREVTIHYGKKLSCDKVRGPEHAVPIIRSLMPDNSNEVGEVYLMKHFDSPTGYIAVRLKSEAGPRFPECWFTDEGDLVDADDLKHPGE